MEITNQTLQNGQKLIIKTKVPVMGISLLRNYVDETLGEMGQSFYKKMFRYSSDGGKTFSEWFELTDTNLSKVNLASNNWYIFEYEYTHQGVRNPMYFSKSTLEVKVKTNENTDIYDKTDFSEYFDVNDLEVIGWAYNVLEKLYENGILPKYYSRSNIKDFQDYWLTVTHFFALIVKAGRLLENLPNNKILFERFLNGRGLFLSGNETQKQREYLFDNYINEYSKRGTIKIFEKDVDGNLGEFLRLINFVGGEFIYSQLFNYEVGWCLGESSPTWDQTNKMYSLVKGYEFGGNVVDLSRYPLRKETQVETLNGKTYIVLTQVNYLGSHSSNYNENNVIYFGDGSLTNISGSLKNIFPISPNLDYEISFVVDKSKSGTLEFSLMSLDKNFAPTNLLNSKTGSNSNVFSTFNVVQDNGNEMYIKGVLMKSGTTANTKYSVMSPNGNNLINSGNTSYIMPQIKVVGQNDIRVRDIKIRPLSLPTSQGQLGEKNILLSYLKNNSLKSNKEVVDISKKYLLPYKTIMWNEFINN